MTEADLIRTIDDMWEQRDSVSAATTGPARDAVDHVLQALDDGEMRVAAPSDSGWVVNQSLKKAVLLSFRLHDSAPMAGPSGAFAYDKVPLKFADWHAQRFAAAGFRAVPGAVVRRSAYIAPGAVLMPSFVNVGAYVGRNTMVDTWATVGSCAQIGANVHLAGGVGVGGVLEPANAVPVVIEDGAFIGSRCMVVEGARVGRGSVLGAGTILNPSIPVIDAETGEEVSRGYVPDYCVAVAAQRRREYRGGEFYLPCVLIIKRMGEEERLSKVALNSLLREHGVST